MGQFSVEIFRVNGSNLSGNQHVNSLHSRLKDFLRHRRGVATKYLGSYLRWFHLTELGSVPTPRDCLSVRPESS
jgi:hypothetical protein